LLVTSSMPCPKHQELHSFEVDMTEAEFDLAYQFWKSGKFIQDAFPNMDPNHREMLITGTCQEAWDEMFPEEEEE